MRHRNHLRGATTALLLISMLLEQSAAAFAAAPAEVGIVNAPAAAATPAAPVYGDLSHLVFTATGPLTASLVSPADGSAATSTSSAFEVSTGAGGGVELMVDGHVIPFNKIGKRTVNNKTGETHYTYYGVPLEEGPNDVVLTPLGANDQRGPEAHATIYGPGRAVRLEGHVIGTPVADGRTPVLYQITGYDRYGHQAAPGELVRVSIVRGDGHFIGKRLRLLGDFANQGLADGIPRPNPSASDSTGADIAQPTVDTTPLPFATPDAHVVPPGGPQISAVANAEAIGDTDTPVQSLDVPLGDCGTATLRLVPGLQPGEIRVRASLADIAVETQTYVDPYLRKPMVLGLATTGVGTVPGVPGELDTAANNVNARMGRIAIYGVGQITKTAQAMIAYDTADSLQNTSQYGSFTDNPNERPYQTFGDGSQRRDDALSRDHLYARVDDNRSNAMWGEFQASTGSAAGDGFNQLVAGAKVELAGNNAKLTAFNARNDVAYARQIFSPTGLATLGALLHPDIIVGSDTVSVVTLDKRTGLVLLQTVLARNVDYTLDYGTGQIRFYNPPLPFDLNFNPQQVLIQYEYDGGSAKAQTSGGRFEAAIGGSQAVRFGAGYVNDATGAGNFTLFGQDVVGKLNGGSWTLSHETSSGSIAALTSSALPGSALGGSAGSGNAYHATLAETSGNNHLSANFDTTTPDYENPFGGISSAGLLDYRVAYQRLLNRSSDSVTLSFDHEQNNLPGAVNSTSNASLTVQGHITKRVKLRGGINVITSAGGEVATDSALDNQVNTVPTAAPAAGASVAAATQSSVTTAQVDVGAEYKVAPQVGVSIDRITSLSGPQQLTAPSQTTAQINVDTPHHGKIYLRELWADAPVESFAAATTSLTTATGSTRSTAIGIEQSVGANTTVDSEYAVENTGSGSDIYSAIGGREKFYLGKNLHGDGQIEHAASIGSNGGSFNLYGLDLAYAVANRFRATAQYQLRTGNASGYTLDLGAAGALSDNVSAVVSSNESSTAGFKNVDTRASIAYRPALNDRAVTIFGVEAEDGNVSTLGDHTQVLSLEELYRPDRRLELAGRYAYKLDGDAYYPAHSSLFGARITQRVGSRFDVAGEARWLAAHSIAGASTTGFALEAGYRLGAEMRLAAGYNFTGSPDPSLALAPTRRGLYATATSVIDRIFGWGKDDF